MALLLGNTQECIRKLQDENTKEALLAVGKAEGLAQGLLQRSIKSIYLTSNYSKELLEKWIKEGKVAEKHRDLFLQYIDIKQKTQLSHGM